MPFSVLTVCTGNICRSPLAEQVLRARLAAYGITDAVMVTSGGLGAVVGAPMEPLAAEVSVALGGDPSRAVGEQVSSAMVRAADLILTMTRSHRDEVLRQFPAAAHRVFTLVEYERLAALALVGSGARPALTLQDLTAIASRRRSEARITAADDVEDPYHRPRRVYEEVGSKIDAAVSAIAGAWDAGRSSSPGAGDRAPGAESTERVWLRVLENNLEVRCTGDLAAAVRVEIESAWKWCVTSHAEAGADLVVEAWGDAEAAPAVFDAAWRRGAVAGKSVPELMHFLSSVITTSAITAQAGGILMLHGCGIALPDGRVVAFVGPSGMGKTTVARTLAQEYGYVTDETVAVHFDGRVVPYPKPLSLVVGDVHGTKEQVSPEDAGLVRAPEELRLAAVVLLDRREDGPMEPVVTDVPLLEGLAELAAQVSFLAHIDNPLHTFAAVVEHAGGIARVTYREAETLSKLVPELVGGAQ